MKLGSALAILALATLAPSAPAAAAKDDKLPRCNGRQKRPANPYGTVLPTIAGRQATSAAEGVPRGTPSNRGGSAAPAAPTNLFPGGNAAPAAHGSSSSDRDKVPAIGAIEPCAGPTAALQISYASC